MEVYVLTMDVDHEGSQVLGVYVTKGIAQKAAGKIFKEEYSDLYILKSWNKAGEADFHFKDGDRYAYQCFSIAKYPLVEYNDQI